MQRAVEVSERFSFEIPAHAEYVSGARLFAAAVARHLGASEEQVEDVKVAISEACALLLTVDGAGRIRVDVEHAPRRTLTFDVTSAGTGSHTNPPGAMALEVLRALMTDVRSSAGCVRFCLTL